MMHLRTVKTPPVLPPKADKPFTPPPPGFLEADAKRCNERLNAKPACWREDSGLKPSRITINLLESEATVLAVLNGPMRSSVINASLNMHRMTIHRALERLEAKGLVKSDKGNGRNTTWERVE